METVNRMKIIVQTIPIMDPGGVQEGRFKVLYHDIPELVNIPPIHEQSSTDKGNSRN